MSNGDSSAPNRSTTLTSSLLRSTSTMPCFLSHGFTEGRLLEKKQPPQKHSSCVCSIWMYSVQFLHILLPAVIIINTCAEFIVVQGVS